MGKPCENRGETIGKWENQGKIHRKTIGKPWETHRKAIGKRLEKVDFHGIADS